MNIFGNVESEGDPEFALAIEMSDGDSNQLQDIVRRELFDALSRFAAKNRGYKTSSGRFPGSVLGEYFQLERKLGKLWAGFIQGDEEAFHHEPAKEVIDDMIGHLLLMKWQLTKGNIR